MKDNRSDKDETKLTLFIYMQSLTRVLTRGRSVLDVASLPIGSIFNREEEVQSILEQFYEGSDIAQYRIKSVDLIFINSIFHKSGSGSLEAYKNRLAAHLFYHKSFFKVPVTHDHIALRLTKELEKGQRSGKESILWFHLRHHHLFVIFSTPNGENSISSFEVRKTLDVYYYMLFNIQTLSAVLTGLKEIVISGELLHLDNLYHFFEDNVTGMSLVTYWDWKGLLGRPPDKLNLFLPEVNI